MTAKNVAEAYAKRVWNDKDTQSIDKYVHDECIIHSSLGDFHGKEALKKIVNAYLSAFPDLHVKNIAVISENDLVVTHWEAKGTHKGDFKGFKPAGKTVPYPGVTIYRIKNEKIVEYWAYLDMNHLLQQIQ